MQRTTFHKLYLSKQVTTLVNICLNILSRINIAQEFDFNIGNIIYGGQITSFPTRPKDSDVTRPAAMRSIMGRV